MQVTYLALSKALTSPGLGTKNFLLLAKQLLSPKWVHVMSTSMPGTPSNKPSCALQSHVKDLDASLSQSQKAELVAFTALIEHKLDVAVEYNIWWEKHGFAEYTKVRGPVCLPASWLNASGVAGNQSQHHSIQGVRITTEAGIAAAAPTPQAIFKGQPFPLNYVIPFSMQREACKRLVTVKEDVVYAGACQALAALSDRLRASGGQWVLGSSPCSLDALLLGHLMFLRSSPAAAPVLRQKVRGRWAGEGVCSGQRVATVHVQIVSK